MGQDEGKWFVRSLPAHIQDMQEMAPVLKQMTLMVEDYMDKFQNRKKNRLSLILMIWSIIVWTF